MTNQKGYIHISVVITISVIAITMIGAIMYFKSATDNAPQTETIITNTTPSLTNTAPVNAAPEINTEVENEVTNTSVESLVDDELTADWEKYTNTEHNYSFMYPPDWQLGDSPTSNVPSPTVKDIAFDGPGYDSNRFAVRAIVLDDCNELSDCIFLHPASFGTGEETSGLSDTTVGGVAAMTETITRTADGDWHYFVHYVYKDDKLYIIHTVAKATDVTELKPTFDNIRNTFQFTD